jgi:membrane fusion protein (multidrug efflux system)
MKQSAEAVFPSAPWLWNQFAFAGVAQELEERAMDVADAPTSKSVHPRSGNDETSAEARIDKSPIPAKKIDDEEKATADSAGEQNTHLPEKKSALGVIGDHPIAFGVGAVVLCAALLAILLWWLQARHYESTDDAFIDGRPVAISALVAGSIVEVPVTDNQLVSAGTILARIDDRDYLAAQAQANAQIEEAQAGVANVAAQLETQQARIDQTGRQVAEAQAALNFSKDENTRYQNLVQQGAGTVQRAQQASSDLLGKQAALDAAVAANTQAEKQLGVLKAQKDNGEAQVRQAQAQSDQAAVNLSRVVLQAPVEGRVTRLTGAAGAYAGPGQTLMMLVPTNLWVTANYEETQLADMRPGQPVTIEIDAYGRNFPGRVDSIQAGSGDAFSLLPAENATGNYVKVVQRVPVKIVFDKAPDVAIGPGMSVAPSVKVR